jgi:hypothetical protein
MSDRDCTTGRLRRWGEAGVLVGLVLLFYFLAWRPVRGVIAHKVAAPVLQEAARIEGGVGRAEARGRRVTIVVPHGEESERGVYPAPAGVVFLLPALFIAGIAPRWPYWLFFGLGHILLSGITLIFWCLALAGWPAGAEVAAFTNRYVSAAYSIGVPVLVLERSGRGRVGILNAQA